MSDAGVNGARRADGAKRYILPLIGLILALLGYAAQNVFGIFNIEVLAEFIRGLDRLGLLIAMGLLGFVEGTVILCLYVPGTAILIVLLLALQPGGADAAGILLALNAGTLVGYAASWRLGRVVQARLPGMIGAAYLHRIEWFVGRYGLLAMVPLSFHPNNLAFAFAILGYSTRLKVIAYLAVALAAQTGWWIGYASTASLIAEQRVVDQSNFYLYLSGLFALWLGYELLQRWRGERKP